MTTDTKFARRIVGSLGLTTDKAGTLRHPLTAWIVLVVCCVATFIGWSVSRSQLLDREYDRFEIRVGQITNEVQQTILTYEQVLLSARAFMMNSIFSSAFARSIMAADARKLSLRWIR